MQKFIGTISMVLLTLISSGQARATLINDIGYAFTPPNQMNPDRWDDPAELERAWEAGIAYIPGQGRKVLQTSVEKLMDPDAKILGEWPILIFMHGCSGIKVDVLERMEYFAEKGFAVIAPASYARSQYPRSCNAAQLTGALYPDIVYLRIFDAIHAVEQVKTFDWVDETRVVLGGHSEGAVVAALFETRTDELQLAGRLIESWTCSSQGFPQFEGLNAEPNEMVLAQVNIHDPWLQTGSGFEGSCGAYFWPGSGSEAIFYNIKSGHLHAPLRSTEAQEDAFEFFESLLED